MQTFIFFETSYPSLYLVLSPNFLTFFPFCTKHFVLILNGEFWENGLWFLLFFLKLKVFVKSWWRKRKPQTICKKGHSVKKKYRELTLLQLTYYPQPYFLLQHLGIPSGQMSKAPRSYHYWSESFFWSRKFSVCPSKSTSIHITTYDENIEFETISSSLFFVWYKMLVYHVLNVT